MPAGAIVFDRDGLHVFVVENGIVHGRKITETRDLGTEVEISDGVKKGDHVVLTPPVELVLVRCDFPVVGAGLRGYGSGGARPSEL